MISPSLTEQGDNSVQLSRWRRVLIPIFSCVFFALAIYALHRLLVELSYRQLIAELSVLTWGQLGWAFGFTLLSFIALTGYDWSALMYIRRSLPYRTVILGSFCGYAISNTVGFSLISGGSVRYRVYLAAGLDEVDIGRVAVFSVLAFWLGINLVGAAALSLHPELVAKFFHIPASVLRVLGAIVVVTIAGLVVFAFKRRTPVQIGPWRYSLPSGTSILFQLLVSVLDLAASGACLYVLIGVPEIPFLAFLVVYAMASMAGASSHVPGGLGIFESLILLALQDSAPASALTAALVMYRIIYYLLPLTIAIIILTGRELREYVPPILRTIHQVRSWSSRLVPVMASGLAFLNGVVLLVSTATPGIPERMETIKDIVPLAVIEASTILGSIIGLMLLIIARGLYRKLNGAYVIAVLLCLSGSIVALSKGIDYEEALILTGSALILWLCREEFYRRTSFLNSPFTSGWIVAIACALGGMVWLIFFSYKHVEYAHELWWQFEYDAEVSRSLRAGLGAVIGLVMFGVSRLLTAPKQFPALPTAAEFDQMKTVIRAQDDVDGNLALMGDKRLLFSANRRAFIMYGSQRESWIAFGDPVGAPEEVDELAWQFRELADQEGARVAFYQTRAETLPLYLDMGLTPLKLGEEAIILLDRFSLAGNTRKAMRHAVNRADREGLRFEIWDREQVATRMNELATISSEWLAVKNTREKRFSLGAFDPDYVRHFAAAVVCQQNKAVAFATLLDTDTKMEASVDLMRHTQDAPASTMLYLFIQTLLHFKELGFQRFTLGMAPLSGLENHPLAPLWHRFGYLIYNRGERFYNFQGLREFKEKFDPIWEPRYLITSGGLDPIIIISDVASLISGGMSGVFKK
jgi:phosphatidylglycerol lysyltransferase